MTDEEYDAIDEALACADDEGRLGLIGHARMMASVDRLRAVEAAARGVIAASTELDEAWHRGGNLEAHNRALCDALDAYWLAG